MTRDFFQFHLQLKNVLLRRTEMHFIHYHEVARMRKEFLSSKTLLKLMTPCDLRLVLYFPKPFDEREDIILHVKVIRCINILVETFFAKPQLAD